jgi:hypothetical protein
MRGKTPILLGPLERANLNYWNVCNLTYTRVKYKVLKAKAALKFNVYFGTTYFKFHVERIGQEKNMKQVESGLLCATWSMIVSCSPYLSCLQMETSVRPK